MTTTTTMMPEPHCRRFGARGHQWAPAFATDSRYERCACGRRRIPPYGLKAQRHPAPFLVNDNPSVRLWGRGPEETTCANCVDLVYHKPTTRPPRWVMESDAWDGEPYPQRGDYHECRKRRLLTDESARQQPTWAACQRYERRA